jgi:ACS family pantothenate transporter-like MFS transporter
MMIINAIMTFPIGIYGFVMFPGTPHTVKSFWLTEEEREMCLTRLPPHEHYVVTWPRFKQSIMTIISTWRYYLFSALFMVSATSFEK